MSRLFISHSSRDNVHALAFQNWLSANGWPRDDIFIDLHDIGAGERWRETLRKANSACEAVILLASPEALGSVECQKELELAEALGKEIILAILRDLSKDDPRLARFSDRQFVDLSAFPLDHIEALEFDGRSHRVGFNPEALAKIKSRLDDLGIAPGSFAWPPKGVTNPEPYPGLTAFSEDDAGIFFGREADIMAALTELRLVRRRRSPRLIVIDAASGAGKSSFLRAGLWPRLMRDPDYAPLAILRPAQGILTGPDGVGRRIAPWFERQGIIKPPGAIHQTLMVHDEGRAAQSLADLVSQAVARATQVRRASNPEARAPAAIIAIDQGEELFASENDAESRRFLTLLASLLKSPPPDVDPYVILTIRADSVESLLVRVAELGIGAPKPIYLPPLSPAAYREVTLKPAEVYSNRVRRLTIEPALASALVQDATGADALPLLAFTLSQMFADYRADGNLTAERYYHMGGIGGSIRRALRQGQTKAGAAGSDGHLRRLLLPRLATWDPDAGGKHGAAKRIVALYSDCAGGIRTDLAPLADALIEARLLTRGRETLEVAHEALLRLPPLSRWLEDEREFLIWRERLGKARAMYEANARGLLVGRELQIARDWSDQRADSDDVTSLDRAFIGQSIAEDNVRRAEADKQENWKRQHELEAAYAREQLAEIGVLREREKSAREREKAAADVADALKRVSRSQLMGLAAAMVLATVAAVFGAYALRQQHTAQQQEAQATQAAKRAELSARDATATRQEAVLTQTKLLTDIARRATDDEKNPTLGLLLALEALPDAKSADDATRNRPAWQPAEVSLEGAVRALREKTILRGHEGSITGLAVSRDGTRLATAGSDSTARIWNLVAGGAPIVLRGLQSHASGVAFSPDGTSVVTGGPDNTARVWDTSTGTERLVLNGHKKRLNGIAWSPDGSFIVTTSEDMTARLWNSATGAETKSLTGADVRNMFSVAISPDNRRIATGSNDGKVRIWDVLTGAELHPFKGHDAAVYQVAFSPDNARLFTASGDKTVRIWDTANGEALFTLKGHDGDVNSVAISPDGTRIATASDDKSIRIWDAANGEEQRIMKGHDGPVTDVAWSKDGALLFSGSSDGTAREWDASADGKERFLKGHEGSVLSVAVSRDGNRIATGSADATGRVWDAPTGHQIRPLSGHRSRVNAIQWFPDGNRIVTGSNDNTTRIWDVANGNEVRTLKGHADSILGLAISRDGSQIVSASADETGRIWNAATGAEVHVLKGHKAKLTSAVVTPDGKQAITGSLDGTARIWDVATGAELRILKGHAGGVTSIAVTSDGALIATGSTDATARIWSSKTSAEPMILKGHESRIRAVAFSPDDQRVATASGDGAVRIWNAHSGGELAVLRSQGGAVSSVAWLPDGTHIVIGSDDNTARILSVFPELPALRGIAVEAVARCLTPAERRKFHLRPEPPPWCAARKKWPYDPDGALVESAKLMELNKDEEATIVLAAALTADRNLEQKAGRAWAITYGDRGSKLLADDKDEDAKIQFDLAMKKDPSIASLIGAAWANAFVARGRKLLIEDGDEEKAKAQFEFALTHNPAGELSITTRWAQAYIDWGARLLSDEKDDDAKANFERALLKDGSVTPRIQQAWGKAFAERGGKLLSDGKDEDAKLQFAMALAKDPSIVTLIGETWSAAHLDRGRKLLSEGNEAQAKREFDAALKNDPSSSVAIAEARTEAYLAHGTNLLWQGKVDEAKTHFESFLARDPSARSRIAKVMVDVGHEILNDEAADRNVRGNRALKVFEAAILWASMDGVEPLVLANAMNGRGRSHRTLNKYTAALVDVREAARLGSKNAFSQAFWITSDIGYEHIKKGEFAEGLTLAWFNLLDLSATDKKRITIQNLMSQGTLPYSIGEIYALQQISSNTTIPTKCDHLASHPHDPFRITLGIYFADLKLPDVLSACEEAVRTFPEEPRLHYQLARAQALAAEQAAKAGQHDAAAASHKAKFAALEMAMAKGYPMAFNNVAYALERDEGVEKNVAKAADYYLQTSNRTLHCCWAPVARHLLTRQNELGTEKVRRVVAALTPWAAALGSKDARDLHAELVANATIPASPIPAPATFTDLPPWLRF